MKEKAPSGGRTKTVRRAPEEPLVAKGLLDLDLGRGQRPVFRLPKIQVKPFLWGPSPHIYAVIKVQLSCV